MATEYVFVPQQNVALNSPILLSNSTSCSCGNIESENQTGVFILRGSKRNSNCNCPAQYRVFFNANVALPDGATVTPINVALTLGGVPIPSSLATITPAAVEQFNNITCSDIVKVPQCGYLQLAVESVADASDPTVTPAPVISVKNASLTIERIA